MSIMGQREYETTNIADLPNEALRLGPDHYPTGHRDSVGYVEDAILATGLEIVGQQHVVDGLRTMTPHGGNYGKVTIPGANVFSLFNVRSEKLGEDYLIGYRNSVAQAFAAQACIGKHFPVCTNVSLFGDDIIFRRKNTRHANLDTLIMAEMTDKVVPLLETVQEQLDRLSGASLTQEQARAMAFTAFAEKVVPAKLIGDVEGLILDPSDAPEIWENEGNALGLMHTFTRVTRDLGLRQQAEASQRISRFFGFGQQVR
jgi:hypothetical protein